jgi:probable HAF family extracellular repeat protein
MSIALVLMLAAAMAGQTATQPPVRRYRVIELPLRPWHLSNSGQVAGKTSRNQAAVWSRRRGLQLLPVPKASSESEARGSNVSGYVIGFTTGNDQVSAFTYKNGKLALLPDKNSKAFAVNDSGEVVGESEVGGKPPVAAVLWKNGRLISLGGCCGGAAKGVNHRGQIIGDLYDQAGRYKAFLWEGARLQTIGSGSAYSSAIALNDAGHVLLQEMERGIFLWRGPGSSVRIEVPNGQPADGRALNNADEVVGAFGPYFDADHAFLWSEKDGFRDLNGLIPANSGWKLQVATGINDRDEIVGFGDHNGDDDAGFLLIPQEK